MPTEMGSACFLTGGFNHRTKLLKETLDSFLWLVFLGVVWFFFFFFFFRSPRATLLENMLQI